MSWQTGNPPKSGQYLATAIIGDVYHGQPFTTELTYDTMFGWNNAWSETPKVLAWQPLPEPYDPATEASSKEFYEGPHAFFPGKPTQAPERHYAGDGSPGIRPLTQAELQAALTTPSKTAQAPWNNLLDGYTPPGLEFHDARYGRLFLAQQPGSSWDGWLLVRNPEDTGWVSLRKATDGDLENLGLMQVVQQMLSTAAPEARG